MKNNNNNVEEIRTIFMIQSENLNNLLELLANSNDAGKVEIVSNICNAELEKTYGLRIYSEEVLKYRLETLDRFISMCYDAGLIRCDLVIWSHFNAIIDRLESMLCASMPD